MPRVSYLNTRENRITSAEQTCESVAVLLRGSAKSALQLSKIIGKSPNTTLLRLKNPMQFTLEELIRAGVVLGISPEEMFGKIRWKANEKTEETA